MLSDVQLSTACDSKHDSRCQVVRHDDGIAVVVSDTGNCFAAEVKCGPVTPGETPTGGGPPVSDRTLFEFKSGTPWYHYSDPQGRLNAGGLTFNRNIFAQLESRTGKVFTLDACCDDDGSNRLVDSWCCPTQPFTQADCAGYHVWLAPPVRQLHSYIAHYLDCKRQHPATTSACILVPKWRKGKHAALLKGMRLLQEYPAGTPMCTAADGRQWQAPWPFQVWYDAPAILHAGYVIHDSEEVVLEGTGGNPLMFDASISGHNARVKVDTGASHNFLSAALVEAANLAVTPCTDNIQLADGTLVQAVGVCKARVKLKSNTDVLPFYVLRLSAEYDALLGEAWLKASGAKLDFTAGTLTLRKGKKAVTVAAANKPATEPGGGEVQKPYLSALQVKRAVRKGAQLMLLKLNFSPYPGPPDSTDAKVATATVADQPSAAVDGLMSKSTLDGILCKHKDVFAEIPPGLVQREGIPFMRIDLQPGKSPPVGVQYRLSKPEKEECEKQIKAALEKGWITPSTSPFGAPILFVRKKDGVGLRLCCDYRALNKLTIKQVSTIPRIDDLLDQLNGVKVLSAIDLQSGYNQLAIHPDDRHKTAFRTPMGLFEWCVVPFGLTNAPAYFSQAMTTVFGDLLGKCVLVYLDDILVFSKSAEEHAKHLDLVLSKLAEYKLYAKLSKCHFNLPEVEFLGHFVGRNGVKVDPRKVQIVKDWPVPRNQTEMRSFLGLANYFRRFIHAYSTITRPLHALTGDGVIWNKNTWTVECQEAFDLLKEKLTTAPTLALPDFDKDFEVICDASKHTLGAILVQDGRPIAFESRKLTPAEVNYDTTERELVAVMHALNIWRCYLDGKKTRIISDHEPLKYLQTKSSLNPRQIRWSQFLERFNYEWEFRAGRLNAADPMSRAPHAPLGGTGVGSITGNAVADDAVQAHLAVMTRSGKKPAAVKLSSPKQRRKTNETSSKDIDVSDEASTGITWLEAVKLGYKAESELSAVTDKYQLTEKAGLWYRPDGTLYVPTQQLQSKCLEEMHDAPYSGHKGIAKTTAAVARLYW